MILKLFKYDFMNIGKKLIPFYIAALVIGIIKVMINGAVIIYNSNRKSFWFIFL